MEIVIDTLFVVLSYLVGAIPTGVILARLFLRVDITSVGSGNIGATNVMRAGGKVLGVATLVGDAIKGALPLIVLLLFIPPPLQPNLLLGCGVAAFAGHLFPVYLRFKGGKGVATALGIFTVLFPLQITVILAVFLAVVWKWRYVSLGSIVAAALIPMAVAVSRTNWQMITLSIIIATLVIWKHSENIHRLLEGTESKVFKKTASA